jgi:Ca2+-binding EF-hand superfamily protein
MDEIHASYLSFPPPQIKLLRSDGNGEIGPNEFKLFMSKNSAVRDLLSSSRHLLRPDQNEPNESDLTEEEMEKLFTIIDVDHSGKINFNEFVAACIDTRRVDEQALKEAFNRLDYRRRGKISVEDVKLYLGDTMDEDDIRNAMKEIASSEIPGGEDADVTIDYHRFHDVMSRSFSRISMGDALRDDTVAATDAKSFGVSIHDGIEEIGEGQNDLVKGDKLMAHISVLLNEPDECKEDIDDLLDQSQNIEGQ